jgi:peptide/nickel transport system substrate-binding protein
VAVGAGSVWVTNAGDGTVSRIPAGSSEVTQDLPAGAQPTGIAFGDDALWIADAIGGELLRVDIASGESEPIRLPGQPSGVAFTPDGVWVSVSPAGIARVDPGNLKVTLAQGVGNGPTAVLSAFASIWVANSLDGTVSRLEPSTGQERTSIPVGDGPNALAAAAGSIWVANEFDGSVTEIDPSTNGVTPAFPVGGSVASLAADGDRLWLSVGASAAEHRGGTLKISSTARAPASLDPAVAYDVKAWQILTITNDTLVGYKKVGGPEGTTLVPDLAAALPEVSPDGLTYRFVLRNDIHYSTGEPVRPEDFRYGLERAISLTKDAAAIFGAIDGVRACADQPSTCDLGDAIEVEEGSVTINLAHPDPDLPYKLALPFASPVPAGTPIEDQGLNGVPGTGPYTITRAGPKRIELGRNKAFREWSAAAQPAGFVDGVSWTFRDDPSEASDRLNADEVDWLADAPQPEDVVSLLGAHPDQVVLSAEPVTFYVGFDVSRPPFRDVRVRQAVNLAIDRDHIAELLGGPTSQSVTCQILPSSLQGYEPFCPFTLEPKSGVWSNPDPVRARALIGKAGATGQPVELSVMNDDPNLTGEVDAMTYVVDVMHDIGLDADLHVVKDFDEYVNAVYGGEPQMFLFGWGSDYPRPGDFIESQFHCGSPVNVTHFCSHRIDRRMQEAKELQTTDPAAANSAWSEIEHDLVEASAWVPFSNHVAAYVFSARAENVQVHPQWGLLLSRLWVQ